MIPMKPIFLYACFEYARKRSDYKMARVSSETSCQQARDRRKLADGELCRTHN